MKRYGLFESNMLLRYSSLKCGYERKELEGDVILNITGTISCFYIHTVGLSEHETN